MKNHDEVNQDEGGEEEGNQTIEEMPSNFL